MGTRIKPLAGLFHRLTPGGGNGLMESWMAGLMGQIRTSMPTPQ